MFAKNWQRVLSLMALLVILLTAARPVQVQASVPSASHSLTGTVQRPVGFAVSQPLRSIKIDKAEVAPEGGTAGPVNEFRGGLPIPRQVVGNRAQGNRPGVELSRPEIQPGAKVVDPPAPGLDVSWAGLSQGVNRVWYGYGVYPPDTQGDVGPNHYIQVVNIQMAIFDLNQPSAVNTPKTLFVGPINTLWKGSGLTECEESADGDPVVVYDEYADRWLVSQFALPNYPNGPFYECIAISQTGDPMGSWYLYQYSFPVMNDYPKFGVWHDGYYMSINQFTPWTSPAWAGQGVVVFDKVAMQSGNPSAGMIYIDTMAACSTWTEPECFLGGMLPADADGTTPPTGPEVFMQFDDDAWGYSPDQLQLWTMVPDWVNGTATFSHLVDLPTAAFDSEVCPGYARNCIPQKDTTQGLDAISDRLMYRLQFRDFGTYKAMVVNHTIDVDNAPSTAKGRAGVRWYELRDTGSGWSIYQQGNVDFADGKNRWMASAAMDDVGNIAIGYSVSNATMYPGMWYTVHLVTDAPGTVRAEKAIVSAGGGSQTGTGSRWGDYSMMSVYPQAAGGCDFFYTNEYLRGTTPAEWYTWIGVFHNASCYTGDVTAPDTTIDSDPGSTINVSSATFTFSGTDNATVSGFECSLDGGAFASCTSPKTYTGLTVGAHHFEVRAVDNSSNVDPTPATFDFTVVDNTAPDTTITVDPGSVVHSHSATFEFSGTDDFGVAGFECSLDGSAFATCTSPLTYNNLANGAHHFEVRAVDNASNVDPTPATFDFTVSLTSVTFQSQSAYDGWILESGENTNLGGTLDAASAYLFVGDDAQDKQYKAVLDFNTATLPDNAVIVSAYLKVKKAGIVGTNPFTTHGNLWVDARKPFFGSARSLQLADFAAATTGSKISSFNATPASGWYTADVTTGASFINRLGTTQFRIYFNLDDNDDMGADYFKFFSGNATVAANRPVLVIEYYVP